MLRLNDSFIWRNSLTFIKAIPFMIASLAPALVVCAISKELRMPSNRQEAKVELEELA